MSKRILLDASPDMGMMQYIEPDDTGVTLVTVGTNVQAALDENSRKRGVNKDIQRGTETWGHHVASIPTWVYEQFCRENPELRTGSKDAQAWLLAKLNDRDYCHLKTYDGRA
jgi:hypothetical protein|tara:strand:- start:10491 stop:10826 length:336 start_codon:yes stop_codon:yes gene_type:complete